MHKTYFVSGIDTGIGKTLATGLMLRHLVRRGVDAITVKLVQTGTSDGRRTSRSIAASPAASAFQKTAKGLPRHRCSHIRRRRYSPPRGKGARSTSTG